VPCLSIHRPPTRLSRLSYRLKPRRVSSSIAKSVKHRSCVCQVVCLSVLCPVLGRIFTHDPSWNVWTGEDAAWDVDSRGPIIPSVSWPPQEWALLGSRYYQHYSLGDSTDAASCYQSSVVPASASCIGACSLSCLVVCGYGVGLATQMVSQPVPLSGSNYGQVAHTHVPLSSSSIIWQLFFNDVKDDCSLKSYSTCLLILNEYSKKRRKEHMENGR